MLLKKIFVHFPSPSNQEKSAAGLVKIISVERQIKFPALIVLSLSLAIRLHLCESFTFTAASQQKLDEIFTRKAVVSLQGLAFTAFLSFHFISIPFDEALFLAVVFNFSLFRCIKKSLGERKLQVDENVKGQTRNKVQTL